MEIAYEQRKGNLKDKGHDFLLRALCIIFEEREGGERFCLTLAMHFNVNKILLGLETI